MVTPPTNVVGNSNPDPPPWGVHWDSARPVIENYRNRIDSGGTSPIHVMRVNQRDSRELDDELLGLLKMPIRNLFSIFKPGLMESYAPEVQALLELLFFRFTIMVNKPTPGCALQNLRYRNEALYTRPVTNGVLSMKGDSPTKTQRLLYLLGTTGVRWGWARLLRVARAQRWREEPEPSARRVWWVLLQRLHTAACCAHLLSLLLFLRQGRYPDLVSRLLRMRLVPAAPSSCARSLSFEFQNRQMVWEGFTALLLSLSGLVDWAGLASGGVRAVQSAVGAVGRVMQQQQQQQHSGDEQKQEEDAAAAAAAAAVEPCGLCSADPPQMPYVTSCGHAFCYFCLRAAAAADPHHGCAVCDRPFTSSSRLT